MKSNNTCPICRRELFTPSEDDIDEDDELSSLSEDDIDIDEAEPIRSEAVNQQVIEYMRAENARTARMSELVRTYCVSLHLNDSVIQCSHNIVDSTTRMLSLTGRSETSLAAASVYLASHLRRQPKTLREIAQVAGSTEGAIQTVYRRLAAHHHSFPPFMGFRIYALAEDGPSSLVSFTPAFFFCAFIAPF